MIRIQLFGPTVVIQDGQRRNGSDFGGVKPRQLLEMLALNLGTPMSKDLLADRLWEGQPPASYIATIESYVCGLRRRLGLATGRRSPLATTNNGYVLDPAQVEVDVVEIRALVAGGDSFDVARALDLASSQLLVDEPYAAWANGEREIFDELMASACTSAAQSANAAGDNARAVQLARAASQRSFFSEPAVRELMRGLAGTGSRSQALQEYEKLRAGMLEEMGVEPSALTRDLYVSILRGEPKDVARDTGGDEISVLVRLLQQALKIDPAEMAGEPAMLRVGRLLLERAG